MIFRIVCAWCLKDLGEKKFSDPKNMTFSLKDIVDKPITHSICKCCKAKVMGEIEQLNKGGAGCAMIS